MTIGEEGAPNDAVKVSFTGKYSSLVANGWQDGASCWTAQQRTGI